MTELAVHDLYVYPLKSAAGVRVSRVELDAFGVAGDRRWMVVGRDGRFLSQRELAEAREFMASSTEPHRE